MINFILGIMVGVGIGGIIFGLILQNCEWKGRAS
jgi:hypothetical protein